MESILNTIVNRIVNRIVNHFRQLPLVEKKHLLDHKIEQQQQQIRKIEESIRSSKWWRNAFNTAFTVVTVGIILGSVVLTAYVKVHVAVIAATAAAMVMKTVAQWISSIWEQRNDELKEKKMAVEKKQGTLQHMATYMNFHHQDDGNDYDEEAALKSNQEQQIREIEESIRSSRWWRNALNAAFTVVTVGIILGSIVLAAYVKVDVAVIAVTAAAMVMMTVEQWISSIWEQRNDELKEKKMAVEKKQGTLQHMATYMNFHHQDDGNDYNEEAALRGNQDDDYD